MNSPWSTESPNFMNDKNLETICRQGFLTFSVSWEKQTEFLFTLSQSTTAGKPWFQLSTTGHRPALSSQKCKSWIPHLHEMNLIGNLGGKLCYTKWHPLCLGENSLGVTWICVSRAVGRFAQLSAYYFLLHSKINSSLPPQATNLGW